MSLLSTMPHTCTLKTCILCKEMWFYGGDPDCSEDASGWESRCRKGHWLMGGEEVEDDDYRENLLKAVDCYDFVLCSKAAAILEKNTGVDRCPS